MKNLLFFPLAFFVVAGCQQSPTPAPAPVVQAPSKAPVKLTEAQELAKYCRVCVLDHGEKVQEFLPSRLDKKHAGQTYKFCRESCRKSFDANPRKYQLPLKSSA